MGKAAVHLLLKLLADTWQVIASQCLVLKPTLLVGASSVAAATGRGPGPGRSRRHPPSAAG